eukprot:Awhi_evm1s10831
MEEDLFGFDSVHADSDQLWLKELEDSGEIDEIATRYDKHGEYMKFELLTRDRSVEERLFKELFWPELLHLRELAKKGQKKRQDGYDMVFNGKRYKYNYAMDILLDLLPLEIGESGCSKATNLNHIHFFIKHFASFVTYSQTRNVMELNEDFSEKFRTDYKIIKDLISVMDMSITPAILATFAERMSVYLRDTFSADYTFDLILSLYNCETLMEHNKWTKEEQAIGVTTNCLVFSASGFVIGFQPEIRGLSSSESVAAMVHKLVGGVPDLPPSTVTFDQLRTIILTLDRSYFRQRLIDELNKVNANIFFNGTLSENEINPHSKNCSGIGGYKEFKKNLNTATVAPFITMSRATFNKFPNANPCYYLGIIPKPQKALHLIHNHNFFKSDNEETIPLSLTYEKGSDYHSTPKEKQWDCMDDLKYVKCGFTDFKGMENNTNFDYLYAKLKKYNVILTRKQGIPIWHIVRRFRVSSTLAYLLVRLLEKDSFWDKISKAGHDEEEETNAAHEFFDVPSEEDTVLVPVTSYTPEELLTWDIASLTLYLARCNCPVSKIPKSKNALWNPELTDEEKFNLAVLKSWFSTPFGKNGKSSKIFQEGHDNELLLAKALFGIFKTEENQFEVPIKIVSMKQCGLLARRSFTILAASPHGLGVLIHWGIPFLFVLQLKTRVFTSTILSEEKIARHMGKFIEVNLHGKNLDEAINLLSSAIPSKPHRIRVLHEMATVQAQKGLLTYGKRGGVVIRCILITVDKTFSKFYLSALEKKLSELMPWLLREDPPQNYLDFIEPYLGKKGLTLLPEVFALTTSHKLCQALLDHFVDVAFAYGVKFSHVIFYNLTMGGEDKDALSKAVRFLFARNFRCSATCRLLLEYLLFGLKNAFILHVLGSMTDDEIKKINNIDSFRSLPSRKMEGGFTTYLLGLKKQLCDFENIEPDPDDEEVEFEYCIEIDGVRTRKQTKEVGSNITSVSDLVAPKTKKRSNVDDSQSDSELRNEKCIGIPIYELGKVTNANDANVVENTIKASVCDRCSARNRNVAFYLGCRRHFCMKSLPQLKTKESDGEVSTGGHVDKYACLDHKNNQRMFQKSCWLDAHGHGEEGGAIDDHMRGNVPTDKKAIFHKRKEELGSATKRLKLSDLI